MRTLRRILCCVALLFVSLFLGIGYAQLSNDFEVKGMVSLEVSKKVFISNVLVKNEVNAQLNNQSYTSTTLNTTTKFSPQQNSGYVVLEVTFYNGSDLIYEYESETIPSQSNSNVAYQIVDLSIGQKMQPKTYLTAQLFLNSSVNATLDFMINFNFVVSNTKDNVGVANHVSLIDAMLNDLENGMNTADSYLNDQISSRNDGGWFVPSRDTLGSMAITQGNTLEDMFGDSYATNEKLAFLLQFMHVNNDDVIDYYYLYTTSVILGSNGSPNIAIGQPIYQVYRTKIVYDNEEGKWISEEMLEGYATSAYYEESQPNWNINKSKIPSFEPDTWKEGKLGTSFSDAAWTTVNQTSSICAEASNNAEKRYYKVTIPANRNYTFSIDSDNETQASNVLLEIYNNNQSLASSAYGSITFPTSGSNTTYYIVLSGSTTMDFKFTAN